MPQQILVFVSRPYTTKASVPWDLSQCQVQELPLSQSRTPSTTGLTAIQQYGPLTFDIIQQIITQKNTHLAQSSAGVSRWALFEVVHGCIQSGNTFSFVLQLEGTGQGDNKTALPGY